MSHLSFVMAAVLLPFLSPFGSHTAGAAPSSEPHLVPLFIRLPTPSSGSGPSDLEFDWEHVERPSGRPRPPLMVPAGTTNLAPHCRITASDPLALEADLQRLVDDPIQSKDRTDFVYLRPGPQWLQVDLGAQYPIYGICLWHSFAKPRSFHGVVVQIADDAEFSKNVRTLFNNDYRNLVGLGEGKDREYFETYEGKLIEVKGQRARFVRFYSAGASGGGTYSRDNHYFAIGIYGLPHL